MRYSFFISQEEGQTLKELILQRWEFLKDFAAAAHINQTMFSRMIHGTLHIDPNQAATIYDLLKEDKVKFLQEYQTHPPSERMHQRKKERYWHWDNDPLCQQYRKLESIYRSSPPPTQQHMIGDLEQLAHKYFSAMVNNRRKQA